MCDSHKNDKNNKGDEDMAKAIADIKPFEIDFKSESERQEFIKWANTKSENYNPIRNEMIRGMKEMRRIRKRGNN